jgi:VIT1/CCC1 family predicted Fe2+/Mn2+ transporter
MLKIKQYIKTGLSFGLTSGIVTTLGLLVGLYASTKSRSVVIGGILTIAISDSCSDALGIHIAEESDIRNTHAKIWATTLITFLTKFFFAGTFLLPVIFLPLELALTVSVIWAILAMICVSLYLAYDQKKFALKIILEHLLIAFIVILVTYFVGIWIKETFAIN